MVTPSLIKGAQQVLRFFGGNITFSNSLGFVLLPIHRGVF
jgi:hypothetical protein